MNHRRRVKVDCGPSVQGCAFSSWVLLLVAMAFAPAAVAEEPCARPICRDGYHYNGERCQSEPAPITGALSHYYPEEPLCAAGWRVEGPDCVKNVCCDRAACRDDERYRDGYCHRGPTFFGWRSHHRATCDEGWVLDERRGTCHLIDCGDDPPPPARAAGRDDGPPPARRGDGRQPPPPARAAGRDDPLPRQRPTAEPPEPPVVDPVEVTRLLPVPCVERGGRVTIEGVRFGRRQGDRQALLGGHGISVTLRVTRWSDTRISAILPDADRIERGQWYYVGIQNGESHWISNLSRTLTICGGLE